MAWRGHDTNPRTPCTCQIRCVTVSKDEVGVDNSTLPVDLVLQKLLHGFLLCDIQWCFSFTVYNTDLAALTDKIPAKTWQEVYKVNWCDNNNHSKSVNLSDDCLCEFCCKAEIMNKCGIGPRESPSQKFQALEGRFAPYNQNKFCEVVLNFCYWLTAWNHVTEYKGLKSEGVEDSCPQDCFSIDLGKVKTQC